MGFRGGATFVVSSFASGHSRQRLLSAQTGFFYCLVMKKGAVKAGGTVKLWTDVIVRPPMILQLFVKEKLSFEAWAMVLHMAWAPLAF